jgi:hypothetical protein
VDASRGSVPYMRHTARCALRVVVVDKPSGSPLHLL